jgi:hypothetical protein
VRGRLARRGDLERSAQPVVVLAEGPAAVVEPAEVPGDVRAAVTGDWAATWIRITAERVLSYSAEGAAL